MREYDPNHFQFVRQTKLPRSTFNDIDRIGHIAVGVVCTVIAVVLLVCAATGLFS